MNETKHKIIELLAEAEEVIPSELKPDLPPGQYTSGSSEWYDFEYVIWALGEDIRQLFINNKSLRKDIELQRTILRIATDPKTKRGRQSFIMLLGYTFCSQFAHQIAEQLSDPHGSGTKRNGTSKNIGRANNAMHTDGNSAPLHSRR